MFSSYLRYCIQEILKSQGIKTYIIPRLSHESRILRGLIKSCDDEVVKKKWRIIYNSYTISKMVFILTAILLIVELMAFTNS